MNWFINIAIVLAAFFGMEGVVWLTHKYVMHGIFWPLHRDCHLKDNYGFLKRNDFFFLIFALPGIACLAAGTPYHLPTWARIGTGITQYGACCFFVHDLFIHHRIKVLRDSENCNLKAIRRAHKMHHKHTGKYDGESFGMLWVSWKYSAKHQKTTRHEIYVYYYKCTPPCVSSRGIRNAGTTTLNAEYGGRFLNTETKNEFLKYIG